MDSHGGEELCVMVGLVLFDLGNGNANICHMTTFQEYGGVQQL